MSHASPNRRRRTKAPRRALPSPVRRRDGLRRFVSEASDHFAAARPLRHGGPDACVRTNIIRQAALLGSLVRGAGHARNEATNMATDRSLAARRVGGPRMQPTSAAGGFSHFHPAVGAVHRDTRRGAGRIRAGGADEPARGEGTIEELAQSIGFSDVAVRKRMHKLNLLAARPRGRPPKDRLT